MRCGRRRAGGSRSSCAAPRSRRGARSADLRVRGAAERSRTDRGCRPPGERRGCGRPGCAKAPAGRRPNRPNRTGRGRNGAGTDRACARERGPAGRADAWRRKRSWTVTIRNLPLAPGRFWWAAWTISDGGTRAEQAAAQKAGGTDLGKRARTVSSPAS